MAVFDFNGTDVTGTGGNYGVNSVANPSHPTTSPSTFTEQGISFAFSSDHESVIGGTSFNLNHYHYPSSTAPTPPDATGTATLQIVDVDLSETFLSAIKFNVGFWSNLGAGTVSVIFSNTVTFATSKFTFAGSPFTTNVDRTLTNTGNFNKVTFIAGGGSIVINSITGNPNCFMTGTAISTPDGEKAVEDLTEGDTVLTADGRHTRVKWVAEQQIDPRFEHPSKINPVCIRAGALAEGLPKRDLYVTADHALEIDGHLINAGALTNGSTIYQMRDMPLDPFCNYHVETEAHELLLAEGVAAESYIDYAGRENFDNADDVVAPGRISEMALPRISAKRLVPEAILKRLETRAEALARRAA